MLLAFGIPKDDVARALAHDGGRFVHGDDRKDSLLVNHNPKKKSYMHLQSDWFKQQLLPGPQLDELTAKNMVQQEHYMQFDKLEGDMLCLNSKFSQTKEVKTLNLGKFCRRVLSLSAIQTFFGQALLDVEPDFRTLYQKWEDDSWKIFYNYPHFMASDLHAARLRAIQGLVKYYELPNDRRPNTAWIFNVLNSELSNIGFTPKDRAGLIM